MCLNEMLCCDAHGPWSALMMSCWCVSGHQQLHVQQHGHLQASGHAADRGAGQPVRLAHRQGRLQDQRDQGGERRPRHMVRHSLMTPADADLCVFVCAVDRSSGTGGWRHAAQLH